MQQIEAKQIEMRIRPRLALSAAVTLILTAMAGFWLGRGNYVEFATDVVIAALFVSYTVQTVRDMARETSMQAIKMFTNDMMEVMGAMFGNGEKVAPSKPKRHRKPAAKEASADTAKEPVKVHKIPVKVVE